MHTDADRYADLDTHRTRTNIRPDDGTAYDFARAHADQLADGNVVPDLDTVADRLADAGIFAHLDAVTLHPDPVDTVPDFVADTYGKPRTLVFGTPRHGRTNWAGPTPYDDVDPRLLAEQRDYPNLGVFTD